MACESSGVWAWLDCDHGLLATGLGWRWHTRTAHLLEKLFHRFALVGRHLLQCLLHLLPRQIVGGLLECLQLSNVGVDRSTPIDTLLLIRRNKQVFCKIHNEGAAVAHCLQ